MVGIPLKLALSAARKQPDSRYCAHLFCFLRGTSHPVCSRCRNYPTAVKAVLPNRIRGVSFNFRESGAARVTKKRPRLLLQETKAFKSSAVPLFLVCSYPISGSALQGESASLVTVRKPVRAYAPAWFNPATRGPVHLPLRTASHHTAAL